MVAGVLGSTGPPQPERSSDRERLAFRQDGSSWGVAEPLSIGILPRLLSSWQNYPS